MLEARQLGLQRPVRLDDISVTLPAGGLSVILGPNGAGKSTLLHLLGGALRPTGGSITLDGQEVSRLPPARLATLRAMVEQQPLRPAGMAVATLLDIGHGLPDASARRQAMDATCIHDLLSRDCATLSGGEIARVHLARALHQLFASRERCRYLLLDEPTAALDIGAAQLQLASLRQLAREHGIGVVAVLHDVNLAAQHADHVLLLKAGRAMASGAASDVLQLPLLQELYDSPLRELRDAEGRRAFLAV
ncbi:ATP-binding cassette domain-containing protein [Vogesella sp. LIG4]|uniref:ATP-binding cassette domain-containing protein n=1 Tax=Vogesella sp. LIG4 TaxID=1192162 RepID=UPI00081F9D92|nr:ATP-binding cassette domain-containing protein [Vogesella sp. LIG4]SCK21245.1 iron complex transport system ATP-binding protein [Vogesella sp. LIG4]